MYMVTITAISAWVADKVLPTILITLILGLFAMGKRKLEEHHKRRKRKESHGIFFIELGGGDDSFPYGRL